MDKLANETMEPNQPPESRDRKAPERLVSVAFETSRRVHAPTFNSSLLMGPVVSSIARHVSTSRSRPAGLISVFSVGSVCCLSSHDQ